MQTESSWLYSVGQNLLSNAVWYLLAFGGTAVLAYLKKRHSAWLSPILSGVAGGTLLTAILIANSGRYSQPLTSGLILVSALAFSAFLLNAARKLDSDGRIASASPRDAQISSACPFEWVHGIAQSQAQEIQPWIHVESEVFVEVDLFRERPYLDLRFLVRNGSVYRVSLTELSGTLRYANVAMDVDPRWIGNHLSLGAGETNDGVIRVTLKDREDVLRILNLQSAFSFANIQARIETQPETAVKDFSFAGTADDKFIREKYPKLNIEILDAVVRGHHNFDKAWEPDQLIGSVFNLKLRLLNERERQLDVKQFSLVGSQSLSGTIVAEEGDIYEGRSIQKNVSVSEGPKLDNLYSTRCIRPRMPLEGWLQFLVPGKPPGEICNPNPSFGNLVVLDAAGEEHSVGVPPPRRGE